MKIQNQFVSNIDPSPAQSNNGAGDPFCVEGNAIGYQGMKFDPAITQNGVKQDAPTGAYLAANFEMTTGKRSDGTADDFCRPENAVGNYRV